LLAYDRGGAEITQPKDEYTARDYGAYRTTSDLTCALIEGTTNNAFIVAMPDGEYTVWLIASDAEWDPPLFEVWATGWTCGSTPMGATTATRCSRRRGRAAAVLVTGRLRLDPIG